MIKVCHKLKSILLLRFTYLFFKNNFFNIYLILRERERQSSSWGGAEKERETHNLKQVPGSEQSAQSPTWGSNPQTAR